MIVTMAPRSSPIRTFHFRITSQIVFSFIAVLGIFGIGMTGFIYPFFFCPASPGACAGCPIWVIEHGTIEIASGMRSGYLMIAYLIGMFLAIGVLVGRSFCGWACPVGTLQDLFSFLNRKLKDLKPLIAVTIISASLLLASTIIPTILADRNVELQYYMFIGYIGTLASFVLALCGMIFIKRSQKLWVPIVMVTIGCIPWLIAIVFGALDIESSQFSSIELMGLFGLMFQTIGLVGLFRYILKDKDLKVRPMKGLDRWARLTKVGLLILIAPTSWIFDTLLFTDFDPIGGITATIPELILNPGGWAGNDFFWYKAVFVSGVLVLVMLIDRAWCRYLCPIGAMYGPTNKISMTDIDFLEKDCVHCQLCIKACPMGINPKEAKRDPECIRCGRCAEVCPTKAQKWAIINKSVRGVFKR
jgi:polyferredoxin